jgi:hypothetical protein
MYNAEPSIELGRLRVEDRLKAAARERRVKEALRTAPNFVPTSRWRDVVFYSMIVGPLAALGFLGYFAQQIVAAA